MTIVNFNPTPFANFQFNATLDGVNYVVICTWNIYAPRYYINVYNNNGTLIVTNPVIASLDDFDINLVYGYFTTSKIVYRLSSNNFEISP